jgi:hypothetical protein
VPNDGPDQHGKISISEGMFSQFGSKQTNKQAATAVSHKQTNKQTQLIDG